MAQGQKQEVSAQIRGQASSQRQFIYSLLSALLGVGLIALSVYFAARDDFLAKLLIHGGGFLEYVGSLGIAFLFIMGVVLVGRHILKEDSAQGYFEQTPY